jgi:hypothetical protein
VVTRDILATWLGDPTRLLMRILDAGTDIPVPPVLWYEPDPGYLGAPFLVMRRIEGRVPTDIRPTTPAAGSPRPARPSGGPCGGPAWPSWPGCTGST